MAVQRLFQIFDTQTRERVGDFFPSKPAAKTKRRELNGSPETHPLRYIVAPGPDHRNFHGKH